MKRMLVTGATGLLGINLALQLMEKYTIIGVGNRRMLTSLPYRLIQKDLLSADAAGELLREAQPDVIVHCAAMANIDACEKDPETAIRINGAFPGEFAAQAAQAGIQFVHISTDAVFDGIDCGADGYKETDATAPNNVYAQTKLAGERAVLEQNPHALTARVNFYGWSTSQSRSLAEIFYYNLSAGRPMKGFTDVFFSTLYVENLVELLDRLIEKNASGLYHVFSAESQSKYAFGVSIAERFGLDAGLITPVSWKEGGLAARRSPNLIMNTDKLRSFLGTALPTQVECLDRFYRSFQAGLPERIHGFAG